MSVTLVIFFFFFFANYNKQRINIDHQHDRWVELKETLRVQTHAEVPLCM
jgi:hypothetical protein